MSLTAIGRRFAGPVRLRHKIKRFDRLLGNRRLQGEARSIYAALCRVVLGRIAEPLILIDWSDLKADQSLHLLPVRRPLGGGVHPLRGGSPPTTAQQPAGSGTVSPTPRRTAAGAHGAGDRRRRRIQGALLPRGRAPGVALGRAGARARLRAPDHALGKLQGPVQARHAHRDDPGGGRVGAQRTAAGAVCPGAPAAQGAAGQDGPPAARPLQEERAVRTGFARDPWLLVA